jgi:branched-chain amino acid transport system substrate-binding protein
MSYATKLLMLLAALAFLAAACGGDDDEVAADSSEAPTEIAAAATDQIEATTEIAATPDTLPEGVSCDEPITVGVITDQSGALAIYGSHINRGVPIGFAYATGGEPQGDGKSVPEQIYTLDNCEIRVVFKDDQSNAELSATAALELIEAEGADIIIGSVNPGVTEILQGIARENNVVLIAAPAAATNLTGKTFDPNTFRASRTNYQEGMAICDQFVNNAGYKTFLQIAPDYSFGYEGAQAYEDACTFFGGEFLQQVVFAPADTTDFTSYLTPLADSGADAFLVTWFGGGFVPLLGSAVELSVINDTTVLGAPFVDNVVMPAFFGNAVGTTSVVSYHHSVPSNAVNDYLIANQAAVGGSNPDLFDADGMNAAIMVVEAVTATGGAADADSLKAAMEDMSFEGPKGLVEIRAEDHVAVQDMYVVTLTGFDSAGPIYESVATVRPQPPCLLEGAFTSRCGDLPVGSLEGS